MRIDSVWMAVTINPETGDEALCAAIINGQTVPLMAFCADHVTDMQEQAEHIAVENRIDIRIIKMTTRLDEGFISGKRGLALNVKWPGRNTTKG